jgi:hypothetical protein
MCTFLVVIMVTLGLVLVGCFTARTMPMRVAVAGWPTPRLRQDRVVTGAVKIARTLKEGHQLP